MNILVVNCGSSSIKWAMVDSATGQHLMDAQLEGIGEPRAALHVGDKLVELPACPDHESALKHMLLQLDNAAVEFAAIGHRVVHGGEQFVQPTQIDDTVCKAIAELASLAPLHNAASLAGIVATRQQFPQLPQVAVFDTAFHATLSARARAYALPAHISTQLGIRRYGFHGISHESVSRQAAQFLGTDLRQLRLISCHLGNGSSVTAIENGRSVETSMGMTPLEGLVMGSRSGDLDPGIMIRLLRELNLSADGLEHMLNHESGLLGMAGSKDMRVIEDRAAAGDEPARLAIHAFTHRLRKYIGAYAAVMGGVDAIVFTGGIGQNSAMIRHRSAQRLEFLGAQLDEDLNRDARVQLANPVADISLAHARTRLLVVATDEERLIAERTAQTVKARINEPNQSKHSVKIVPIAISARHVHLTEESIASLFGPAYQLTVFKELSQPGQFAAHETVTLVGPRHSIEHVRVVGPPRKVDQVEITRSDEFYLGLDAPVRLSGDLQNTPGISLAGPQGKVQLTRGVICAKRHLHMTPQEALAWGVAHGDSLDIAIDSDDRDLVFRNVLVRVNDSYRLEMHIDTDEANAAGLDSGDDGVLVSIYAQGRLVPEA
ncbi:MAG: acetate/propionate family kinase [Xanthomonadales bacterium]|nr:acetate/propionate family kinase [Xanthomonadales bacterium]